jgi:hypothetical protein
MQEMVHQTQELTRLAEELLLSVERFRVADQEEP